MSNEFRTEHFSALHRFEARVSQLLDGLVYTQRHGLIHGMRRRGGLGFIPEFLSRKETREERFFRSLDLEDRVIFDIGAFQGLVTLFFSRTARQVVTYEPNPSSHARVLENLRLNGIRNVRVRNFAVGDAPGSIVLAIDPLMPGAASAEPAIRDSIELGGAGETLEVPVVTIDEDIRENDLPDPSFVKIDIEGFELQALKGMQGLLARARPDLYLEMHGATEVEKRERVQAIVEFLFDNGYADILHIESGQSITPHDSGVAAHGHLFCRYDRD